ncbi:MAG TPA: hypothetical protein VHQ43_11965 [Solirubrobacterales bacterium]|jgi:hypothetical protein|nr:hypothetical protein [Solirubrobacterales bacterium]
MAKIRATIVLLSMAALALSIAGGTAWSAPATPPAVPFALGEEVELEAEEGEEETAAEECEEAQAEFAAGEISVEEVAEYCEAETRPHGKSSSGSAPEECVLRSAHGHATVDAEGQKLKLTIGYTTYEPTPATIDLSKGPAIHRHLGRSGVLRIVESFPTSIPNRLVVAIKLPATRSVGCPSRRLVLFPK